MRSAFARFPWCRREDARKWRRGSDAGGMSICDASGVEVVDVDVEGGGVGSDNISDSEVEVFRLKSGTRKLSTSLLWESVRSSAEELAWRGTSSVCFNDTTDGGIRCGHDRKKCLDTLNVSGRIVADGNDSERFDVFESFMLFMVVVTVYVRSILNTKSC